MKKNQRMCGKLCKKTGTVLLCMSLLCAGCGRQTGELPELFEPVAGNASYRPVEYGRVGAVQILFATVVPTDYAHCFHTNVTVAEINVEIGDYVQAGDVLAYADREEAEKNLKQLQSELAYENETWELQDKINQKEQKKLEILKSQAEQTGQDREEETAEEDAAGEDTTEEQTAEEQPGYDHQLRVMEEQIRYDALLHEYRAGRLKEDIAKAQQVLADGTLRAQHSGYVTYTKNLAAGRQVGLDENIVVVSDEEDICLELKDMTVSEYTATPELVDCEVKYIQVDGKEYAVKELNYTSEELIRAKAAGFSPNVRLTCEALQELSLGKNYPVYYQKGQSQTVLLIGKDSLYTDGEQYFVYVKQPDGEKVRRDITIGAQDLYAAEVTGGLAEGEPVYYESDARMPVSYEPYEVKRSDFSLNSIAFEYDLADTMAFPFTSEYEGTVSELFVEKQDRIHKGDLLCVIDTGEGRAALQEAQNRIDHENSSYQKQLEELENQMKELEGQEQDSVTDCELEILKLKKQLAQAEHFYQAKQLQDHCDRLKEDNDGTGKMRIYAETDGTVSDIYLKPGDHVEAGEELLRMAESRKKLLLVRLKPLSNPPGDSKLIRAMERAVIADIGEQVSIQIDDRTYRGTCIGQAPSESEGRKAYVYSDAQGCHISYSGDCGYGYPAFYVEMEEEFYENLKKGSYVSYSALDMQDVVVLPETMLHTGQQAERPGTVFYYVWRVIDGELVKQYVTVDPELSEYPDCVVLAGIKEGDVLAREH